MAKLFLVLACAFIHANAVPLLENGLQLPNEVIGKVQDGFEQIGVGHLTQYPMKVAQMHADMPRQVVDSPFEYVKKFFGRVIDTPHRLYNFVHDSVVDTRDKVDSLVSSGQDRLQGINGQIVNKLDKESSAVPAPAVIQEVIEATTLPVQTGFGSEELDILSEFNEMEKMSTEMHRRGEVMKVAINEDFDDQLASLLLTEKEKATVAAEKAEFNQFHDKMMGGMAQAESLAEIIHMRAVYLKRYLAKYEEIVANKCAAEYNEEEQEIVKQHSTPEALAAEMRRRADVMIGAISKYYTGIQQSSSASEEVKKEAAEKMAATRAYHEDMMNKMGETGNMKTTMCLRRKYLDKLLPLFETIIAKK